MSQRKKVNFGHGLFKDAQNILAQTQERIATCPRNDSNHQTNQYQESIESYENNSHNAHNTNGRGSRRYYSKNASNTDYIQQEANTKKRKRNESTDTSHYKRRDFKCKRSRLSTDTIPYNSSTSTSKSLDNSYGGNILQNALSKCKTRGIVLLMEQEMERFVKHCINKHSRHNDEYVLLFPVCNSYYRLFLHKIAERYGCTTKSFGDGSQRRVIIYCNIGPLRCGVVPKSIKCISGFIPKVKLKDMIQMNGESALDINNKFKTSMEHMIEILKPNELNEYSKNMKFSEVKCDINGLSHDIICKKALFCHYLWEKCFGDGSEEKENIKEEWNDINVKDIGCDHLMEIEISESIGSISNQYSLMNGFIGFMEIKRKEMMNENENKYDLRKIDDNHCVLIFENGTKCDDCFAFSSSILSDFCVEYKCDKRIIGVNKFLDASDVTKYFCGFVNVVMNKKRAKSDTRVAKRMIAHILHPNRIK